MKDKNGTPIRKQWRIATNSPDLAAALGGRTCHHEKGFVHARIEGSLTPLTALYPKQMCQVIIKSWYKGRTERSTIPVAVAEPNNRATWKRDPHALYIHPLREGVAVPNRGTPESVGLDFQSAHDHTVPAGDKATIGTGLAITIPKGVYGRIAPRSGLAAKHMIDIGAGVIDPDYTGEIKVVILNHSNSDFVIKKGDKIAQLILERVSILEPVICLQKPRATERGGQGFGSTDKGAPAASATFPSHMWSSTGSTEWLAMPRGADGSGHSPFLGLPPFSACVARPVPRKEAKLDPKAFAALEKEWKKLRDLGCWDQSRVREWRDVAAEAKREGTKVHVGRIFDICVEKNHELAEDDPNRKFKGRVVFEGCHVRDESNAWALFSEITSCPATMAAGKVADAYGLLQETRLKLATGNPRTRRRCSAEPRPGYVFPVTNGQRNGRACKTLYAPLFSHSTDIPMLEVSGSSTARPNLKRLDLYPSLTGPVFFVTRHLRPFSLSMLTISSKVARRLTSPKDGDS